MRCTVWLSVLSCASRTRLFSTLLSPLNVFLLLLFLGHICPYIWKLHLEWFQWFWRSSAKYVIGPTGITNSHLVRWPTLSWLPRIILRESINTLSAGRVVNAAQYFPLSQAGVVPRMFAQPRPSTETAQTQALVEGFHSIVAKRLDIIRAAACCVNRAGIEYISRRIDWNLSLQTLPLHFVSSLTPSLCLTSPFYLFFWSSPLFPPDCRSSRSFPLLPLNAF